MLEFLGEWKKVHIIAGLPAQEFNFGTMRVARVFSEIKEQIVKGKKSSYRMWQWRVFLPDVGTHDAGFSWSEQEAQRCVESELRGWLSKTGIQDFVDQVFIEDEKIDEPEFQMPDKVEVVKGLAPPHPSVAILPIKKPNPVTVLKSANRSCHDWQDDKESRRSKRAARSLRRG